LRDITGELAAVSLDHEMTPKKLKAMVEEAKMKEESSSALILTSMCAPISFTTLKSAFILSSLTLVVGSGTRNMMVLFLLAAVSVDHDMTPKEREETKAMVEEAKKKEESSSGKFIFRVRGPPWNRYIKTFFFASSTIAFVSSLSFGVMS
jgi:hypothetical protein